MKWWVAVAALLAGCSGSPPKPTQAIHPASAEEVAHCTYLDDVTGTSGWYGVFAEKGVANARTAALTKAAALGATDVVWQPVNAIYGSTSVNAKAYRCGVAGK